MPRGGYREGAGRPKSGRKVHTIRATEEEWKLIKVYADQVKAGKFPKKLEVQKPKNSVVKKTKKLGQLAHASIIFGNPEKVKYGCFFCVPDGKRYVIKAYFCSESEAPVSVWDVIDKTTVIYGHLVPASVGWTWVGAEDHSSLGPDPETLSKKKTVKAAFACWLSDLLLNQPNIRVRDLQER